MQISLIEFSVENFKTFRNKAIFSMVARKNDRHTFETSGECLLKTSLIYGPNASGKSSILEALDLMKKLVQFSANIPENSSNKKLPYAPFLASSQSTNQPIQLGITFALKEGRDGIYEYKFSFLEDHIVSEELVEISLKGNKDIYFSRNEQSIEVRYDFKEMKNLVGQVRKEALFLSVSAQLNNSFALDLLTAFNNIVVISGIYPNAPQLTFKKIKENNFFKEKFFELLKIADFSITNGSTEEVDLQEVSFKLDPESFSFEQPKTVKNDELFLEHPVYDNNYKIVDVFKLNLFQESAGTQKFSLIIGPIMDALEGGKVLLIDEFDNGLHPLLTKLIIDLFESSELNKNNAQLIVTTHDTSLLSYRDDFTKDQFWFTEKNEFGSAKLFSLGDFELRNDTEYSKKYLEGRFGALPFISGIKK